MVLYGAYIKAFIAAPDDPVFLYALASRYVPGWMVLVPCMAFEIGGITSAAVSGLYMLLTGVGSVISTITFLR